MISLKNIKFWIFDLDNTLYSSTTNIFSKIDKKMCQFIIDELRVDGSDFKNKNKIFSRAWNNIKWINEKT